MSTTTLRSLSRVHMETLINEQGRLHIKCPHRMAYLTFDRYCFFLSFRKCIYFMNRDVLSAHMCVFHLCVGCVQMPEVVGFPGARVIGGCELRTLVFCKSNMGSQLPNYFSSACL